MFYRRNLIAMTLVILGLIMFSLPGQIFAGDPREVKNDGRFIAYDNGTVLDTQTNLMWAAKDNGEDINWKDAKIYCDNYRCGGYSDWRMPTRDELSGLFDSSKSRPTPSSCYKNTFLKGYVSHIATELIDITCFFVWASETHLKVDDRLEYRRSQATYCPFSDVDGGDPNWRPQSQIGSVRALPVRSVK